MEKKRRVDYFIGQVDETPDGCWRWKGKCLHNKGKDYPRFWAGKKEAYAARWVWEYAVGPIPPGFILQRTCQTERCVHPQHRRILPKKRRAVSV